MKRIAFLDSKPNIHHDRFVANLSGKYSVTSFFISETFQPENLENFHLILFADITKTSAYLPVSTKPKIAISWAYDLLNTFNYFSDLTKKKSLLSADYILCDSKIVRNEILRLGFSQKIIVQFPFGVYLPDYKYKVFSKQEKTEIITIRNWGENYGQDIILKAAEILTNDQNYNFTFNFAGDGPTKMSLKLKYRKLFDEKLAIDLGRLSKNQIIQNLSKSTLSLSASNSDGISVSILESMAVGTPVLVTNIEANLEFINEGINGYLFESNSPIALANKLKEIYNSNNSLAGVSKAGREWVEEFANFEKNMPKLTDKIDNLLSL